MSSKYKLAFYVGRGSFVDWAIRKGTRSRYSHVEMVDTNGVCWSSSEVDGGVRGKFIDLNSGNWEVIDIPWAKVGSIDFIKQRKGLKYDYLGILLSHVLPLARHGKHRWFCSEIIGAALGFPKPQTLSPDGLHRIAKNINKYRVVRTTNDS